MSFLISPRNRHSVEAWTAWHLPFPGHQTFRSKPIYGTYRTELRAALCSLARSENLYARYTFSGQHKHDPDLENVLFYNVGCSIFKAYAVKSLCFERIDCSVPSSKELKFEPHAHVNYEAIEKYEAIETRRSFRLDANDAIAKLSPVAFSRREDIGNCARLWRTFNRLSSRKKGYQEALYLSPCNYALQRPLQSA